MPTYQYRCKDCATDLEVVQKFTDEALTDCPACDVGELRKVFNAVGVVFKGSGFYRTDSRLGSGNGSSSAKTPDSATPSEPGGSGVPAATSADSSSGNGTRERTGSSNSAGAPTPASVASGS